MQKCATHIDRKRNKKQPKYQKKRQKTVYKNTEKSMENDKKHVSKTHKTCQEKHIVSAKRDTLTPKKASQMG